MVPFFVAVECFNFFSTTGLTVAGLFVVGLAMVRLAVVGCAVVVTAGATEEFRDGFFVVETHSGHPPHFFVHLHFFVQNLVFV